MAYRHRLASRVAALAAAMLIAESAHADTPPDKVNQGLGSTRQLLLLMDTDKSGKVSRQEFMSFMEAEFERLDNNHDGELDVKELTALRVRPMINLHR